MNRPVFATCLLLTLVVSGTAFGQFEGLKNRIPADSNTLVLINAEKLFGSPIADRERWEARTKGCV